MRILVTGATGFAGGHLVEALLAKGDAEVTGLSRRALWPMEWGHLKDSVILRACDLCNGPAVEAILREMQPTQIYHLAGYAHTGQSFKEPDAAWTGNLSATRTLYDAVLRWGGKPRILYVGSGLIYGDAETPDEAHDEGCLLKPTSPYAASKAAADLASYQYSRAPGLEIVRARPFNHIGPRQAAGFVVADFAGQLARIALAKQAPCLRTGNLGSRRDFTDVRDVVRAYLLLMEHGQCGQAYNVGSEQTYSVQEILDRLIRLAKVQVTIQPREDLVRAVDTAAVRADARKLRRETGWSPQFTLDQTLADILTYWRERV